MQELYSAPGPPSSQYPSALSAQLPLWHASKHTSTQLGSPRAQLTIDGGSDGGSGGAGGAGGLAGDLGGLAG